MVSRRQRLARKRFRGESDEAQVSEEEPKKVVPVTKPKRELKKKPKKLKTHPLRAPGMKPGEGCYMCKAKDHIAKKCPKKTEFENQKVCLLCRERGHTLKHCPAGDVKEAKFCYNCGETGHRLAHCSQPLKEGGTSFADCFLCKKKGHLSKNCPSNTRGIYPKGGCCKLCGEVTHLAKDCPTKTKTLKTRLKISKDVVPSGEKRIVFKSGDDLEDDFGELEA